MVIRTCVVTAVLGITACIVRTDRKNAARMPSVGMK